MKNLQSNQQDIVKNLDISQLYHYKATATLSSASASVTTTFKTDNNPMYSVMPYITIADANGKPLDTSKIERNSIFVNIKVKSGENFFGEQNFPIEVFNKRYLAKTFSGLYIESNTVYQIEFTAQNIPSTSVNLPYSVSLNFVGYQLGYPANIGYAYSRRDLTFPYSQQQNYTITSKSGNTDGMQTTIRTPREGLLVDTFTCNIIDANGMPIVDDSMQDEFLITLKYNQNLILFNNIPIRIFNALGLAERFKSFFMLGETDYSVEIKGTSNANITAQRLDFDALTEQFVIGDTVTGAGGATGIIIDVVYSGATGYFILNTISGEFVNDELITGAVEGSASVNGTLYGSINAYPLTFAVNFNGYKLLGA